MHNLIDRLAGTRIGGLDEARELNLAGGADSMLHSPAMRTDYSARIRRSTAGFIPGGVVTLGMVVLAFLAWDDITTDNATSFQVEYSCLAACAVWALAVAIGLAVTRRFALAVASLLVLGAAVWSQRAIGPGTVPSWRPEYLATVGSLVWFLGLSLFLIAAGVAKGLAAERGRIEV